MYSHAAKPVRLKLVGALDGDAAASTSHSSWAHTRNVRQEIIRENRAAAAARPALEPTDPRWVLAVRAHTQLEGSVMTPDARQRVMRTAAVLGVRNFDASVVIAIVQDHARRGETLADAAPTLALVRRPPDRFDRRWSWMRWTAAIASAIVANLLLIRWLLSS